MLRLGIPAKKTVRMTLELGRHEPVIKTDNDLLKLLMIEWERRILEATMAHVRRHCCIFLNAVLFNLSFVWI
jgi:hypothetical protein